MQLLPPRYEKTPYRDGPIRIAGSLLISYVIDALGRPESLFVRLTTRYFYIDLFSGFVMVMLVWACIRTLVIFTDRRLDWFGETPLRLVVQFLLGVCIPSLLSFFLTYLYMESVWDQRFFESGWLDNEFLSVVILIVFINFYYFTFWLYKRRMEAAAPVPQPEPSGFSGGELLPQSGKERPVSVSRGEKILLLPQEEVASALLKEGYCYIRNFTGDTFVTTYTLDDLEEQLAPARFFRVNRQLILHRKAVKAYSSIENGKIGLDAAPYVKEPCIVSQKRARAFRAWITEAADVPG